MNRGANLQTKHPMYQIADPGQYNDSRMGATIQCYMKGYADPRISKYFRIKERTLYVPAYRLLKSV